ncbi:MAG: L-seryl-tRNA(Sec) selenium transferase [Chloroflexota bacterium]|nr:L-seryl-tRNA(Sec) selenium transferase [Chloroflexota bacterium]
MSDELRKLPSVDRLLQEAAVQELLQSHDHELTVEGLRQALDAARVRIRSGAPCPSTEAIVTQAGTYLSDLTRPTLRPVINASGVIIHTNLGRALLSTETQAAMVDAARAYTNLEYDLEAGRRGSRYVHAEQLLRRLTGAESALVVNNNAGAVLLVLTALAQGREVLISRSQLIEIGGGFRIPDVMHQSGARLIEVGTTNRTHLRDYQAAIGPETAALMRAHHSNFRIVGFTAEVPLDELVALAGEHGLLVFDDLGSGTLLDTANFGLAHEPTIQESVAAGADVISCSGDKLLGGPQAGIILGRAELVARLRRHPLTRALRVDKTTLAGLQATLLHYLKGEAVDKVPVWRMIAAQPDALKRRAERWAQELHQAGVQATVVEGRSTVGGGSLPGETLPTWLVALDVASPDALAARLRAGEPPVIGRIENDRLCLDPRTVFSREEATLLQAVQAAL